MDKMRVYQRTVCGKHPGMAHNGDCTFIVEFNPGLKNMTSISRKLIDFASKEELIHSIYAEIVSSYYFENGEVLKFGRTQMNLYYDYYLNIYTHPKSQIAIHAPIEARNPPPNSCIYPDQKIRSIVRDAYHYHLVNNLQVVIPTYSGIGIPSLAFLAYKVASWESVLYVLMQNYERCRWTTNGANNPSVGLLLYNEFNVNGALRGPSYGELRKIMPRAMRLLEGALDCEKYVGKLDKTYSPRHLIEYLKFNTAGGLISVPIMVLELNGVRYRVMNNGKKMFLFEPAARHFHRLMIQLLLGGNPIFEFLCVMKMKQEWKIGHLKNVKGLAAMQTKIREFFIAGMIGILLSHFLMNKRMFIERGNMIRIGSKYPFGGAYEFAKFMRFDIEGMLYITGDIKGLDKKIKDWQLMLYILAGKRYFNWKNFTPRQRNLVRKLFRILSYNIAHKVVLHVGGFWRFMRGFMYSGGKETSPGNSWILALAFYCWIVYTVGKYPHIREYVDQFFFLKMIMIVVYGDDHVIGIPRILREYFNKATWTRFLDYFFDMELQEAEEFESFLSEFNHNTGEFVKTGPKFLKRYFVLNTIDPKLAPVLPVKPTDESMIRMFLNDKQEPYDYIMSAKGIAWDTMGTNFAAYKVAKYFYDRMVAENPHITPVDVYNAYLSDPSRRDKLNGISKKLGISIEQILSGFPSLNKLLDMHVHDPEKCKFGGINESYDTILTNLTMLTE